MVSPALQLSVKMPENRLQVWAASLLAGTFLSALGAGVVVEPLQFSSSVQICTTLWGKERRRGCYANRAVVYYSSWSEVS